MESALSRTIVPPPRRGRELLVHSFETPRARTFANFARKIFGALDIFPADDALRTRVRRPRRSRGPRASESQLRSTAHGPSPPPPPFPFRRGLGVTRNSAKSSARPYAGNEHASERTFDRIYLETRSASALARRASRFLDAPFLGTVRRCERKTTRCENTRPTTLPRTSESSRATETTALRRSCSAED